MAGRPQHALLLTGPPGVGKTTIVRRVVAGFGSWRARGFTTEETRARGRRTGFRLEALDGSRETLARVGLRSSHRVASYGVDLAALDRVVASTLAPDATVQVYVVDEIGKMECLSPRFVAAVRELLDSRRLLVATVAARGGGFMEETRERRDVELWTVSRENRERLPARVVAWLRDRLET